MKPAVLITGGGARIGKHIALGLAEDGWTVAVHYNSSRAQAEELAHEINKAGGRAAAVQADLTAETALKTLVARASAAVNAPLTALINNASTFLPDNAQNFTAASYDLHMDVNLRAPLALTQQLAAQLPAGKNGCVINMIDQRVLRPNPLFFTYSTAKAALYWATQTLAQSYAPRLRVNGIGPGPTLVSMHQTPDEFTAEAKATLLEHGSPPHEVLGGVRYLLSAKSVTGQMIAVDGGQHLNWRTPDLMIGQTHD
jgi:NAD(P)-dependent dehydrogenase (short-subunit alcohol dehydrogenase family)